MAGGTGYNAAERSLTMACNPHFNQMVSERQVAHTPHRKVIEIAPQPVTKPAPKSRAN
jgi:hypothetical protein